MLSEPAGAVDAATVRDAISEILTGPCFAAAPNWPRPADPQEISHEALRHFWRNGGREGFAQFLRLGGSEPLHVLVLPTVRETVTTHPTLSKLNGTLDCPKEDAGCVADAERVREEVQRALDARSHEGSISEGIPVDSCAERARVLDARLRWEAWVRCAESATPRRSMLPLGALRVPAKGWLIVHGRRGHHSFCDELGLYDLTEGSAYVVSQCGGMFFETTRRVENELVNPPAVSLQAGQVDVGRLRLALWMMLIAPAVQDDLIVGGRPVEVPEGIVPIPWNRAVRRGQGQSRSGSSAETELQWSWLVDGQARASGTLTWPRDRSRAGFARAAALLQSFEETLVDGCPSLERPAGWDLLVGEHPRSSALASILEAWAGDLSCDR